MSETLHSRSRAHIAEEMQSGNNAISKSAKVRADTKTNTMRTVALNGLGLNVTVAVGQQKPIAMNTKQRIAGTMGKQKGELMRLIDGDACESYFYEHLDDNAMAGALNAISEMPTIEPDLSSYSDKLWHNAYERGRAEAEAELIRCKDCKWKQGAECVRFADVRPWPDDFCSRAERREE
jgi:hypothetical protein